MRLTVVAIALGLVALTSAAYYPSSHPVKGVKYADKDFLFKQKFFFEVLRNIHLPLQFEEYLPYTKSYITDESKYVNFEEVAEFFNFYKVGFLGKGELFSIYNKEYMTQTYLLFNFFYNAVDFDTFYKNVVWARENVNEGIFISALTLTVFQHPELKGFVLPAIYEIYPYYFFNTNVIHSVTFRKQYDQKFGFASNGKYNVVYDNYTATYPIDYYGEEKLAYFTEDIGLNAYYYNFMMDYPYFLGTDKWNFSKDRRGELYLYMYQQLIARYYLERQVNFLGPIEEFDYDFPLKTGYWSKLSYYNGIRSSVRDRTTYTELYKKIMTAYNGGEKFVLDNSEAHCGFPDRLLLPKGLPSGYEMTFYFIVTPYYAPKVPQFSTYDNTYQCGVGSGSKYIDDLPFGYPFDRDIDFSYFYTKNMYFKDVLIYHSEETKVNSSY
ncbi:hypothetical protein ZHAS_00014498 [Anopheles sinensis]|uniref:Uncharacterized protein n=1 Tax=Anopheles sinensis TaxID=74873 RepID=A0A084W8G3_ANOSI|nr:hypothetical protein ZHAS_00014498 [Anopheles sinensis]